VLFARGADPQPIRVSSPLTLCIGHSGIASGTKAMVESVARLRERSPDVVGKAFEGIRVLVQNPKLAILADDKFALGRLLDVNQMLLSGIFVATEELERCCDLACAAGGSGAKLTGAGGGGSVIALASGAAGAERVLSAWRSAGFDGFATRVAGC